MNSLSISLCRIHLRLKVRDKCPRNLKTKIYLRFTNMAMQAEHQELTVKQNPVFEQSARIVLSEE
jgi:hypothetical protein